MWNWQDDQLIREHLKDLERETQHVGQIKLALRERRQRPARRAGVARLRGWLVGWGGRLRARNAAIELSEEAGC